MSQAGRTPSMADDTYAERRARGMRLLGPEHGTH